MVKKDAKNRVFSFLEKKRGVKVTSEHLSENQFRDEINTQVRRLFTFNVNGSGKCRACV